MEVSAPEVEVTVSTSNRYGVLQEEGVADRCWESLDISQSSQGAAHKPRRCGVKRKRDASTERIQKNELEEEVPIVDNSGAKVNVGGGEDTELNLVPSINSVKLQTESLLMLPVRANDKEELALIDTGATNNLINEATVESLGIAIQTDSRIIQGLGSGHVATLGKVLIELDIVGLGTIETVFDVVPRNSIRYSMLLGLQFLKKLKISVDMGKRSLVRLYPDGSRVIIYVAKGNKIEQVRHENIPVYAVEDVLVEREKPAVSVAVGLGMECSRLGEGGELYFEGIERENKAKGLDGMVEFKESAVRVFMCNGTANERVRVKAGDKVGKVSTLVELIPDEDDLKDWSEGELKDNIDLGEQLSQEEKEVVYRMLMETQGVMSKCENDIGTALVHPHTIELTNDTPIWQKPRRFADPINAEIDRQCKELLSLNIIEHSDSQWSSPIVPVRKKDGQLRMCVDYRKVNSVTKTEKFPMPNLTDCIYSVSNTKLFTKLDLVKGYYQVLLDEDSRQYTAFSTPTNHYQFRTLSFGLKNSGIAFQKNMQQILSEYNSKNVLIYIDDILIMSESFQEHLNLVQRVLDTLANSGIKIKVSKCEFFRTEITFLGHVVNTKGITKSPEYIDKVRNYPKPTTTTELRQFLGLVNFQRKFVDQCSVIARPLKELTGGPKNKKLVWTKDMEEAFEGLRERISREVTLSYPDYSDGAEMLELFVDASGVGAGGCLVQMQGGEYKTIAYSSMTFTPAQCNYSTIERELLAIRWGIKTFRSFLFGVKFILFSDHKPLLFLHNMCIEKSRLARTLSDLAEYDFTIKYRPGVENSAADAMSRIVKVPSDEEYREMVLRNELPAGLRVLRKVEGGGNSLFEALFLCLEDNDIDHGVNDCSELRVVLVEEVIVNSSKYGIKMDKDRKKQLTIMKQDGQLPCEAVLLVACKVFNIEVWVHHGMKYPVIYKQGGNKGVVNTIHLQCISGVHFNPLYSKKKGTEGAIVSQGKNVNCLKIQERHNGEVEESGTDAMVFMHIKTRSCFHDIPFDMGCVINVGQIKFCAMIDTGAEVSVLSQSICEKLREQDESLRLEASDCEHVNGINGEETGIFGILKFKFCILDVEMRGLPFAVVSDVAMPCCAILGANFLSQNGVVVDCHRGEMLVKDEGGELCYPLGVRKNMNVFNKGANVAFVGNVGLDQKTDDESIRVRLTLDKDSILVMQDGDHALRVLKKRISTGAQQGELKEGYLAQFRRYYKDLEIKEEVLVVNRSGSWIPVVSFLMFVEIVYKVHISLAHIGRLKLAELVQSHFWHPSLDKVCRDIASSCSYCQLYKIGAQKVQPPTLKIRARYPFDLVAMDLLQFTRSSLGSVAVLMLVDHFSKFVVAVPIRNKTASAVVKALDTQVFPQLVRLPDRILTDNGPEFRSVEFNQLLESFNITHIYSTRYRAAGNGAVERVNRTITQLVKPLVVENPSSWDTKIGRAVIIYNNTHHSQLGATPVQVIVGRAHNIDSTLPIESGELKFWEEGHSRFQSFRLGQKVAYRINKIGNQLKYKLGKKYEGSYRVVKIQVNKVTYEVAHCETGEVRKAHHRQLKSWNSPPKYLHRYIDMGNKSGKRGNKMMDTIGSESSDGEEEAGGGMMYSSSSDTGHSSVSVGDRISNSSDDEGDDNHRQSAGAVEVACTEGERAGRSKRLRSYVSDRYRREADKASHNSRERVLSSRKKMGKGEVPKESKSLPVVPQVGLKELERLHCSEPVEYGMCQGLVEDMYSNLKMKVDNYRLDFSFLDWEMSDVLGRGRVDSQ